MLSYYELCTRHPEFIGEYDNSGLEPKYEDFTNLLKNTNIDLGRTYGKLTSYKVASHIVRGEPLELTSNVVEFCLKYEKEVLHNTIGDSMIVVHGYEERDLMHYIEMYPNDEIYCETLEHMYSDKNLHYILINDRCKNVNVRDLFDKKDIEGSLIYLILNTEYNANDMIECIMIGGYNNLLGMVDVTKFNFYTCTCKDRALELGIVGDHDIVREYFRLDNLDRCNLYLRAIKNKNLGNIIINLRRRMDVVLLKRAHEFGIMGIVMKIHYDDEVVGKGTPCPVHILLDLMDELPSHLFEVNIVRVLYLDNLLRVLNTYKYITTNSLVFNDIYHEGIMDYYGRYTKGIIEYIKNTNQDIVLALAIINGPEALHHLLDVKYSSLLQ